MVCVLFHRCVIFESEVYSRIIKKKKTLGSKKTKYIKSSVSVVENAMEKDDVGEREGAAKSFLIE